MSRNLEFHNWRVCMVTGKNPIGERTDRANEIESNIVKSLGTRATVTLSRRFASVSVVAAVALGLSLFAAAPANATNPTGTVMVQTQRMSTASLQSVQNGWYGKGSQLSLACYARGQAVKGYYSSYILGGRDNLWYKVSDGFWVADVDINTGSNNPVRFPPKRGGISYKD